MRLFVYGTLLADSATPVATWLAAHVRSCVRASVPGRLLAIPTPHGWFPALIAGRGGERVRGSVYVLALPPGGLARLDRYEGREYRRIAARALTESGRGRRLAVQLYRWRVTLPAAARPIKQGEFVMWLAARGGRAYAPGRARPAMKRVRSAGIVTMAWSSFSGR